MRMFQYSQRITVSVCNRGNCRIYLGIQFSPFPYLSGLLAPSSMWLESKYRQRLSRDKRSKEKKIHETRDSCWRNLLFRTAPKVNDANATCGMPQLDQQSQCTILFSCSTRRNSRTGTTRTFHRSSTGVWHRTLMCVALPDYSHSTDRTCETWSSFPFEEEQNFWCIHSLTFSSQLLLAVGYTEMIFSGWVGKWCYSWRRSRQSQIKWEEEREISWIWK